MNTYYVSNSMPSTGDSLSNVTWSLTPGEGGYNLVRRDTLLANPIIVRRPSGHGGEWVKLPVQEGYLGRFLEKGP